MFLVGAVHLVFDVLFQRRGYSLGGCFWISSMQDLSVVIVFRSFGVICKVVLLLNIRDCQGICRLYCWIVDHLFWIFLLMILFCLDSCCNGFYSSILSMKILPFKKKVLFRFFPSCFYNIYAAPFVLNNLLSLIVDSEVRFNRWIYIFLIFKIKYDI